MIRSRVKTYRYRTGKNQYIVINIFQTASAESTIGNALASNAVNVQILKKNRK
ncbi:hypothetical protein ACFOLF_02840 [Paenibacillus sepulcri]|uniref:Uncharacterized protein n=1 Tax=Paenibacillus sepulcri TaxID=359917 RepID=A0ABS7CFD6_9BACL|nr:hypothetical protein [Paenibacillus sepulcri]